MTNQNLPALAIVGHPNKGKSSIVSTLSQDSSVGISPVSGTTVINREFPMQVDGTTLYKLIDTPGFQRARAALDWMQQHSNAASDHRLTVEAFVETHQEDKKFEAECQLLSPILDGAGILYVIDGSTPYGSEYDAEMEILRWTGQPSMALINQIGDGEYFDEWQQPLGQYFKIVRNFDAQAASFERQIQLLTGFSELAENWREPLQRAAAILRQQRKRQIQQASFLISDMLVAMSNYSLRVPTRNPENQEALAQQTQRFQQSLSAMESSNRKEVEQLFLYDQLERDESEFLLSEEDLFSESTWSIFGLSRDQLVTTGIVGGAAGGTLLDLGSGGLTLFLGSGIGALVGGAGAWFGSQKMVKTRVLGLPLGGSEWVIGPVVNPNFPWVLLGRAMNHLQHLCRRTHARRDALVLSEGYDLMGAGNFNLENPEDSESTSLYDSLEKEQRSKLQTLLSRISKQKPLKESERSQLSEIICQQIPSWSD
ncbi:MAG: GTPase/DUF3482 domain-containing protein [Acidiferrobacterales bacterium]|nr:GTPase/DUF3482 domain-containing protein [Acidiferrobacterales bacterium]